MSLLGGNFATILHFVLDNSDVFTRSSKASTFILPKFIHILLLSSLINGGMIKYSLL